jgi:hypothetical protein
MLLLARTLFFSSPSGRNQKKGNAAKKKKKLNKSLYLESAQAARFRSTNTHDIPPRHHTATTKETKMACRALRFNSASLARRGTFAASRVQSSKQNQGPFTKRHNKTKQNKQKRKPQQQKKKTLRRNKRQHKSNSKNLQTNNQSCLPRGR